MDLELASIEPLRDDESRSEREANGVPDEREQALPDIVEHLRRALIAKQETVEALLAGFKTLALPAVDGLTFDVVYAPAASIEQLGGDWYDIFVLPDGRVAFTIGDVCGRGLGSAVKMGQAKQAVKVAAALHLADPTPLAVLTETNKVIFLNNHEVAFTTALYGIIDIVNRTVTYASAGHQPPILAKRGEDAQIMPNHGFALGVELDLPDLIHEHVFTYEPGSLMVLYTDGLIEFDHDNDAGERRLLAASRAAVESEAEHAAHAIVDIVLPAGLRPPDDIAVLTVLFT